MSSFSSFLLWMRFSDVLWRWNGVLKRRSFSCTWKSDSNLSHWFIFKFYSIEYYFQLSVPLKSKKSNLQLVWLRRLCNFLQEFHVGERWRIDPFLSKGPVDGSLELRTSFLLFVFFCHVRGFEKEGNSMESELQWLQQPSYSSTVVVFAVPEIFYRTLLFAKRSFKRVRPEERWMKTGEKERDEWKRERRRRVNVSFQREEERPVSGVRLLLFSLLLLMFASLIWPPFFYSVTFTSCLSLSLSLVPVDFQRKYAASEWESRWLQIYYTWCDRRDTNERAKNVFSDGKRVTDSVVNWEKWRKSAGKCEDAREGERRQS